MYGTYQFCFLRDGGSRPHSRARFGVQLTGTAAEIYFWGRVTGQCILRGLYQPCHPGVDDTISDAIARPVLKQVLGHEESTGCPECRQRPDCPELSKQIAGLSER